MSALLSSEPSRESDARPARNPAPRVRCREIRPDDTDSLIDLFTRGFVPSNRKFWVLVLERLAAHPTPPGFPRYGYLLEAEEKPVGALLLIFTQVPTQDGSSVRCNVSSWYVDPAFRAYATMLVSVALKHKDVTYFNISPAAHTLPILEAQGYRKFSSGRVVSVPSLSGQRVQGCRVDSVTSALAPGDDLTEFESRLLASHSRYGCLCLVCTVDGKRFPFVFRFRRKWGVIPFVFLVYCRDVESFVRFARPLGVYLARRGMPLVVLDANGPIPGLVGRYQSLGPKYFKGPERPALGNLSYSERAMFGV